jgi:succinate dehydrogenase / fumarate reductase flavoprotein subunit
LFNADGERFMERYSPKQMELDARDVVARAIAQEVAEGRGTENGGVYLDISHRSREFIQEKLPRMYERFDDLGVDMAADPVEVAPTAHYGMGGVAVDEDGETSVDGLFAIGETMAGVHGANRLGGNSLAETVAFGKITGEEVAKRVAGPGSIPDSVRDDVAVPHVHELEAMANCDGEHDVQAVFEDVQSLMWEHAGRQRDESTLEAGLDELASVRARAANMNVGPITSESFELAIDVGFMLTAAEAVLRGALERTESRGAHHRTDHPDTDPDQQHNIHYHEVDVGTMAPSTHAVDQPGPAVQRALDDDHELDYHQLE